jgi:serine/threonine protein phosphatase PrpC
MPLIIKGYRVAKKPLPGKCIHCLQFHQELTWDHVFPKAWYPSTTKQNLSKWQVPSCRGCNQLYGELEQDLLIRFAMCLDPLDPSCAGIVEKGLRAINPSNAKNDKDRRARLAKRKEILKDAFEGENIPRQAVYPNFGVHPHLPLRDQTAITVPAKSVQRLAEKIVRGISLIEDGKLIEPPYKISYFVLSDAGATPILEMLERYGSIHAREPGIVVRRAVAPEDATSSFFLIEIWSRFNIYAAVQNNIEDVSQAKLRKGEAQYEQYPVPAGKGWGMTAVHATHPGLIRPENEDFILTDDYLGVYLLADGMGGHNAGEVASETAVKTAHTYLAERLSSDSNNEIPTLLADAMNAAHEAVNMKARNDLSLMGMGATLVEVIIRGNKAFICHAGDSRAYHFHDTLHRITRDHTVGDHLLENNFLSREQIPAKQWHTLTQAVGFGVPPVPDFNQVDLLSGDMLLLCSDGLTDMLTDEEIENVIKGGHLNIDGITKSLIDASNIKGGRDNISVVLVKI